jgi:hypothetical protein
MGGRCKADTGHAVQEAARLENTLLCLLLVTLGRAHISTRTERKLDSFGKRIRLAREMELIDAATHSDLKAINDVRAVFAHAELPVRFTSAPIRIKTRAFAAWKPGASARRLFDEAVARAEAAIDARINTLVYEHAVRAFTLL